VKQEKKQWKKSGRKRKKANNREKRRYSSDLTTAQWLLIKHLIPEAKPGGRPRTTNIREVFNAIFYRLKNGCTWENLPKDFPNHKTVFDYYRKWSVDGIVEKIHDILRRTVRKEAGKEETPTAGIIDSQSVKTTQKGGIPATTLVKRQKVESAIFS
jgi:putative transposase